ncbi:hypothetical protein [Roseateles sp. LYH14W]|uniref:TonB-dependent receptor n=1 Tax=Pelomonas parva TaxID=3299032 RepID=A0ABW7EZD6_9BURK
MLDTKVSRDLMKMDGGMMAVGLDLRREKADNSPAHPECSKGSHIGGEGSVPATSASRSILAVYSELSLPFAKGWEASVAARYDSYSDFGSPRRAALPAQQGVAVPRLRHRLLEHPEVGPDRRHQRRRADGRARPVHQVQDAVEAFPDHWFHLLRRDAGGKPR